MSTMSRVANDSKNMNVGDVGFVFHKFFEGHGWFEGRVTQIRPNAAKNKTRRILYCDGDVEDVSVKEIQLCIQSYEKYLQSKKEDKGAIYVKETGDQNVKWKTDQSQKDPRSLHVDQKVSNAGDKHYKNDDKKRPSVDICSSLTKRRSPENTKNVTLGTNTTEQKSSKKRKSIFPSESRKKVRDPGNDFSKPHLLTQSDSDASKYIANATSQVTEAKVPLNSLITSRKVGINAHCGSNRSEQNMGSAETKQAVDCKIILKPSKEDCSKLPQSPMVRRSLRKSDAILDDGKPIVGQVGFIFSKDFPGSCKMRGMVVEVLPGFMRRCVYSDGFQEDITVNELHRLVRLEKNRKDETFDDVSYNPPKEINEIKKGDCDEIDFEMADDIIPFDDTVESMFHVESQVNKDVEKFDDEDSEDEDSLWLTKVASLVNSKGAKSKQKLNAMLSSAPKDGIADSSTESDVSHHPEIDKPVPLNHIPVEKRRGCKVICMNDDKRIVGKVLGENKFGWVEVDFGEVIRKDRTSKFVAVSPKHAIGESMKLIKIYDAEKKVKLLKGQIENTKCKESCSIGSVFYWYCRACKVANHFVEEMCQTCKQCRVSGTKKIGIPSCLLDIVENVCLVASENEGKPENEIIDQPYIPQHVIKSVEHIRRGDYFTAKKIVNTSPKLPMDTIFYWKCAHCTMVNSFKRWSCNVCKRKKTDDALLSPLLQIATEAAKEQLRLQDAVERIPDLHSCAIPDIVMRYLVTCVATASSSKRRCLLPKHGDSDYCILHQDVISLNNDKLSDEVKSQTDNFASEFTKEIEVTNPFIVIDCLIDNIRTRLRSTLNIQENTRNWEIKCNEDAFLCERNEPYPLGLVVRRYFPGHGFHDGIIYSVTQKQVIDEGELRPVLVYRIKYNDGDEEDLLHHEVNSLRQIYDVRSVRPSSLCTEQIKAGTIFKTLNGNVQILRIGANERNPKDNGTVFAKLSKPNQADIEIKIDLIKFQKIVVNKISHNRKLLHDEDSLSIYSVREKSPLPFLEWPPSEYTSCVEANSTSQSLSLSNRSLKMDIKPIPQDNDLDTDEESIGDETFLSHVHRILDDEARHSRGGISHSCHDPAGVRNFISYRPYESITCAICKTGEDEHYLLICDDCEKGYHTYCLRPVVVNIPRDDWSCNKCGARDFSLDTFEDILAGVQANPLEKAFSFLNLPFRRTTEFCNKHKDAFMLLKSRSLWRKKFPKARISEKVDGIYISRNKDRHLFVLPEPTEDPQIMLRSITSIAAAVQYCGMEHYSEELTYNDEVPISMNDASLDLDSVTALSKRNLQLFEEYKQNLKLGVYPPVEIVYDSSIGFMVKALAKMKRHTIITEYVGQVTTVDKIGSTSSDSLMNLLQTGDDETSLIMDPSRVGNMARFFSGINNRKNMSKKKANIRTRRFCLDGRCRVVLFTAKDVEEGEILHYDYNAGIEGKDVESIIRMGFYDTSNFL